MAFTRDSDLKCCGTCKHSRFWLTATRRFRRDATSYCHADVSKIPLPAVPPAYVVLITHKTAVEPKDGSGCPLYERHAEPT
jgi:hypothetical protein